MWTSLVTCLLTVRLFSILFLLLYLTGTCHLRSASSRVISRLLIFLAYAGVCTRLRLSRTLSDACLLPVVLFSLLHPVLGLRWRDKLFNRFCLSRILSDACELPFILFSLLHLVFGVHWRDKFFNRPACPVSCQMLAYYQLFSFPFCILFLAHGGVKTCTIVSACPVSCQLKSIRVQPLIGYLDYKFQIFITVHKYRAPIICKD